MRILLILLGLGLCYAGKKQRSTHSLGQIRESNIKSLILKMHNRVRANLSPPAKSGHELAALKWSNDAAVAAANSMACSNAFYHEKDANYGENFAKRSGNLRATFRVIIRGWLAEKEGYDVTVNTCDTDKVETCDHYKQIVQWETTHVGCGYAYDCQGDGLTVLVCYYSPPGNSGRPPYYPNNGQSAYGPRPTDAGSLLPTTCGATENVLSSFFSRIIGGNDADENDWPWQVSLQYYSRGQYKHYCGGALITDQWVLTASHCVVETRANTPIFEDIKVVLGKHKLSQKGTDETERFADLQIHHEDYNENTVYNDIALLRLKTPVTFNDAIQPVCLEGLNTAPVTDSTHQNMLCVVTGWGITSHGRIADTLQEVLIKISEGCGEYASHTITDKMICAADSGKDSCQGDSGGPLVCSVGDVDENGVTKQKFIQRGIVSWGYDCADSKYPGVYTRVNQYQDWITDKIKTNNPARRRRSAQKVPSEPLVRDNPTRRRRSAHKGCGQPSSVSNFTNERLGEGTSTSLASWPWQVSIQINIDGSWHHVCGGTLLDEGWVITAAKCIELGADISVVLSYTPPTGGQRLTVSRTVVHPQYDEHTHNIALLKLSGDVGSLMPACLPELDDHGPAQLEMCVTTGWGTLTTGGMVGTDPTSTLQELLVPVLGPCTPWYQNERTSQVLCAGLPEGGDNVCSGDIGGPLLCQCHDTWVLQGISSYGFGCEEPKQPGVYTKVASYTSWIASVV